MYSSAMRESLVETKANQSDLTRCPERLTVPTLDRTAPLDIIAEAPMKTFVTSCEIHEIRGVNYSRSLVAYNLDNWRTEVCTLTLIM